MAYHHPCLPSLWLMTDERLGERLWPALARLPRGSGVVFRHYRLSANERRALFRRVAKLARRRGLILLRAGDVPMPGEMGTHGVVKPMRRFGQIHSRAVHNRAEAVAATRAGADVVFLSPLFPTASHPGQPSLGPVRAGLLRRGIYAKVIALGGMNQRRAKRLAGLNFHGWAAIDAWTQ